MEVEAVGGFKYLGSMIDANNRVELLSRIGAAARCAASLRKLMTSRWISRQTKVKVYQTIIRPVVTYGCEAWRMTGGMERRLDVFENGILRLICGAVCEEGVWRRRHNAEIREMTGVPLLSDVVRSHRLRWAGHVARRGENSLLQKVLNAVPEGRRPAGRPRRRWRDAVSEDLRLLGRDEDWQIAKDRQDWRALMSRLRGWYTSSNCCGDCGLQFMHPAKWWLEGSNECLLLNSSMLEIARDSGQQPQPSVCLQRLDGEGVQCRCSSTVSI